MPTLTIIYSNIHFQHLIKNFDINHLHFILFCRLYFQTRIIIGNSGYSETKFKEIRMYSNGLDVRSRKDGKNNYSILKQRIDDNYHDILLALCVPTPLDEINAIHVKVKIERAVAETAKIFKEFIEAEMPKNKNFIIDLSDTLFMDSTFLGTLVFAFKQITAKGRRMNIVLNYDKIKILSAIEPLKKVLHIHPSLEDAMHEMEII